jgi:hypothetical protein
MYIYNLTSKVCKLNILDGLVVRSHIYQLPHTFPNVDLSPNGKVHFASPPIWDWLQSSDLKGADRWVSNVHQRHSGPRHVVG